MYSAPGRSRDIISYEKYSQLREGKYGSSGLDNERKPVEDLPGSKKGRMVLPFEPLTLTFQDVQYYVDVPSIYMESTLYKENKELVKKLSSPSPGSNDLYFPSRFPQNGLEQFKACLWKQHLSYWRSPSYNLTRIIFIATLSVVSGLLFWQQGKKL
ncbi:hypothetical protein Q3G72_005270 [Acer saccharum]|nr:hypothetical protein Q3G72_005270 [Acer saccharum]